MENTQTTEQKNAAISGKIIGLILAGKTVPEATDTVLGEGAFMRIADEVYTTLQAKAA